MSLPVTMRKAGAVLAASLVAILMHSCGGGGGGGASGTGGGNGGPPPNTQPGGARTPTPTPTEFPTAAIVQSGANIAEAAKRAAAGSTVIVSPGTYSAVTLQPGDLQDSVTLFADVTGALSQSPAAPVIVDAGSHTMAFSVSGQTNLTIDGFTFRGGTTAGVNVVDSPGTTVSNCIVKQNRGDGVRFQGSDGGLIFNNLIINNGSVTGSAVAGIRVLGGNDVRVINNTIYKNTGAGLSVGDAAAPSSNIEVKNNIFDHNAPLGILVDPSTAGLQEDFNLNNDGYQGLSQGLDDIVNMNPLFLSPAGEDFHLQAFGGGTTSPAVDAGDFNTDSDLVFALEQQSTQADGTADSPPVDLGYHYPAAAGTPTPVPPPTRPRATATRATSRTPTRAPGAPTPTPTPAPAGRPTRTPRPTRVPR